MGTDTRIGNLEEMLGGNGNGNWQGNIYPLLTVGDIKTMHVLMASMYLWNIMDMLVYLIVIIREGSNR